MTQNPNKLKYHWKNHPINMGRIFRKIKNPKRAVSPVIAVVLLVALTVAAAAVIWSLSSGILDDPNVEIFVDNYGVADTDGDSAGDLIELHILNIGADDAKITEVKLFRDGIQQTSWTMLENSYPVASFGVVKIQTLDTTQQVTNQQVVRVEVKDSTAGRLATETLKIPNILSALPILFDCGDFSTIGVGQNGWTTKTYNTHGGGAGISVSGDDLVFQTNDCLLYYLNNDTFAVQNGIITAEWQWGDDDAIGIAFRIVDDKNYYWVGYTEDHNGPSNRAGENEASFDGPWFINDGKFEIHKLVNGVDTILDSANAPFSLPPGTASNPSGPFNFVISFTGNSLAFQAAGSSGGNLEEIFSITDNTFPNAGYFGVFSLAAASSVLLNFQVTA